MKCLLLIAVHLLSLLAAGSSGCPSWSEVTPCTCKNVAYGLHVVCANIKSSSTLFDAFRRLASYRLDNLLLHGINFSEPVPENFFKDMTVESLQVENSRLLFTKPAFSGLENSLIQLKIMKCSEVGSLEIASLFKLRELHVSGNKRKRITKRWLNGNTPNIRNLNLDSNDIDELEEEAFAQLSELQEISIADNRISSVSRNMFPSPARRLFRIDLSHNILSDLPTDIFSHMPNLETVVLSGNELKTLEASTWERVWNQLRSVYLYENSIVCDRGIEWIKQRKKPPLFEGTCVEPEAMAGKSLKEALFSS